MCLCVNKLNMINDACAVEVVWSVGNMIIAIFYLLALSAKTNIKSFEVFQMLYKFKDQI